jgi:hypothetical protein
MNDREWSGVMNGNDRLELTNRAWPGNPLVCLIQRIRRQVLEEGRKDGPRPVDVDQIDLHQAFMDINIPISNEGVGDFASRPAGTRLRSSKEEINKSTEQNKSLCRT